MNELDLFTAALSIQDSQARAAYLEENCQGNLLLRKRLEELLKAYHQADQVLPEVPAIDPQVTEMFTEQKQDHLIGTIIAGKYKLLEEIGEGGMGTVFVAEQTEPVKRKVAVKLIKPGMDSKSVLARFEAERQALAMMDHPNIAKVLDAGLTEERRPYFVMEYIKGLPLTKYCDDVKLSIDERLKLFIQICQAVQHAHQKGIIHRDLKPTNILIALYDGKPVPKVIDFGLAKALHQSLTERTLHTGHEMVLGTPLYMSPEQAELNNLDIDTRSDIYSLGVILYELLTGVTPLEKQRFKEAAWAEVLRIIKEEEPSKPSTKLSHSASLPSVAAQRQMEPKKLSTLMKGDLDWIVMKALEKDRSRRYETANGFAADVLRYLSGEAVTAVPPCAGYRLRKFVKRNKGKVIAAGLVAATLLLGIIGTTWGLFEAKRQEHLASDRAEGERLAKLDAEAQKDQAKKRLKQIEKANDLLGSIFENLDPKEIAKAERPLQAILVEKLDKAVAQIEGESIGDPLVVAAMQAKFAASLAGLGEPSKAIVLLEKARATRQTHLGPDHPDTLSSMSDLAEANRAAGKLDLALPLMEETLKLKKAKLGPDHLLTINTMNNLAGAYFDAGKWNLALPLFEETLKLKKAKLGPDHPETLASMGNLALVYLAAEKWDLALPLFEETLKLQKAELGLDHPVTLSSMNNLAMAYKNARKLDLALPLLEETLKLKKARLGPDHPDTLSSMNNLAVAYRAGSQLALALPLLEETLKLRKAKLGLDHPQTLSTMNSLASAYQDAGQLGLALPLFEETLKLSKAKLGLDHPNTLTSMQNLGKAYGDANQGEKAVTTLKEFVAGRRKRAKPDDPRFAELLERVAIDLWKCRQFALAEEMLRECLAIREKTQPDVWTTFNTKSLIGGALLGQKKYADAEPLMLKGFEEMKVRFDKIPGADAGRLSMQTHLNEALDRLIQLYTETNKPDEVKKLQAEKEKLNKPAQKK